MIWLMPPVVAVLAGVLYQLVQSARARRRVRPPGVLVDVGGHRVHVVCRGEGQPAVLLEAGVAASSISWTFVQARLARETRVCAYDRAGLAWSDSPSSPRTLDRMVSELDLVGRHVAPESPLVLAGHSFGCFLVLAFAARHPSRVSGLVLIDPPLEWLSPGPREERLLWSARRFSAIGALLARVGIVRLLLDLLAGGRPGAPRRAARLFGPTAARTLERLVGEVRKLPPEVHAIVREHWCQPRCFTAMGRYLDVLSREAAQLARCVAPPGVPLVVISGGLQPQRQIEGHRHLAEAAGGQHVVAPRSGHWVLLDEPDLVASELMQLVAAHRARSARTSPSERDAPQLST